MAVPPSDLNTVQVRLRNAVYLYPMQRRVIELTNIMNECCTKDLQVFFPFLVENIFGVNASYGHSWNLLTISRVFNSGDFNALFGFLHPTGPFFEVIYKLLGDVYLKYEYPLQFLSEKLKQIVTDGSVPQFYADKLQIDPNLREPTALFLNAFEFYLFHFAHHLIDVWQEHVGSGFCGAHETVYLHLSDQYLQHFLPVQTSVVLPVVPAHQTMQLPRSPPPPQNQPPKTPKLFKTSVVKLGSSTLSPTTVSQPHAEIWRSETFVQVIINFWLSIPENSLPSNPFANISTQKYFAYPCGYGPNPSYPRFRCYYSDVRNAEVKLPEDDHLRVIRNMIKHIHYFTNNVLNDGSAMDELRKAISSLCRRPIYAFLRRHIHRWPLDSSFLLILETYLSYIQPWRYVKYMQKTSSEGHLVDSKWFNFIVENFPAYTIIIREILPRFSRMDLTSPNHAHMLFRLCKVLAQPNLASILKYIESYLDDSNTGHDATQLGTPKSPCSPGGYQPAHPNLSFPLFNRLNVIIKQEIQEVECPTFHYKPLFGSEFHQQIFEFVHSIHQSLSLVNYLLNSALSEKKMNKLSIVQRLKNMIVYAPPSDDYTVDERQRTVSYLEFSIMNLSKVFDLPPLQLPPENKNEVSKSSTNSSFSQQLGVVEPTVINPKDWKKRSKLIRYEANPDLEPIRSTEVTFLVRFFHHLSTRINEKYKDDLKLAWERTDIWGNVARQLLAPPCNIYYFDKSVPGNFAPRVRRELPPRCCLRTLASHQTLCYIFLSGLFAVFYGYPLLPFYIFMVFLFLCWIFVKALIERYMSERVNPLSSTRSEEFVPLDASFTD